MKRNYAVYLSGVSLEGIVKYNLSICAESSSEAEKEAIKEAYALGCLIANVRNIEDLGPADLITCDAYVEFYYNGKYESTIINNITGYDSLDLQRKAIDWLHDNYPGFSEEYIELRNVRY